MVLAAGRIVADGSGGEIRGLVELARVSFDVGECGVDVGALCHVTRAETHAGRLELLSDDADALVRALVAHDVPFRRLEVRPASLAEAFLSLTEQDSRKEIDPP